MMKKKQDKKALIAFSGGVDSAVSCLLLQKLGFFVEGVHFIFHKSGNASEEAFKVACRLGIKLHIKDLSAGFSNEVVIPFIEEYRKGRTPNPCVICNPRVKFPELIKVADELGIKVIATGHYALIQQKQNCYSLLKAVDKKKDQSYFLYRLTQAQLERIHFPLGMLKKQEIYKMANKNKLVFSSKESQDACFFHADQKLKSFLEKHIPPKEGDIVDEKGKKLGKHRGSFLFTSGQRQGLELSGGPHYVIGKDSRKNTVFVTKDAEHPSLMRKNIEIKNVSWVCNEPRDSKEYSFKTRYSCKPTKGMLIKNGFSWSVKLKKGQRAVAPGQSCVVYDRKRVMGGGIIASCN